MEFDKVGVADRVDDDGDSFMVEMKRRQKPLVKIIGSDLLTWKIKPINMRKFFRRRLI